MALVYEEGFVVQEERKDVKAMLSAAAFTYIASLISSVLQILRLLLIFNRNRD
ncbi:MAG: zinc metallopeptidase [Holdemania filiformis]